MFQIDSRMWLDIAGIGISLVLFIIYEFRRISFVRSGRIFFAMNILTFLQCSIDILSIQLLIINPGSNIVFRTIVFTVNLACYEGMAFYFFFYIVLLTKAGEKFRRFRPLFYTGLTVMTVLIATSPFTGLIFAMNDVGYAVGPLYLSLYVVGTLLSIFEIFILFGQRRFMTVTQKVSIIIAMVLVAMGSVIQMLDDSIYIIGYMDALVLVIMYSTLENPGEYIVKQLNCYNATAFYAVVERYLEKRRHSFDTVILVGIDDKDRVKTLLSNAALESLNSFLHGKLRGMCSRSKLFYLNDCTFAMIVSGNAAQTAQSAVNAYSGGVRVSEMIISLSPYACLVPLSKFKNVTEIRRAVDYFEDSRGGEAVREPITTIKRENLDNLNREALVLQSVRNAIRDDRVILYFQPILDGETKKFKSVEALARIYDDNMGMLYPGEFIPLAEKNGLIIPLGERVFERVCRFIRYNDLKRLGLDYIEVNLSTVQCMQDNLPERLMEIMDRYQVEPKYINIEITETAYAYDKEMLLKNTKKLKEYGLTFSMDDFGTGFSNAESLFSLPLKLVKIDLSLVQGAMKDEAAAVILKNFISMLKELNLPIVAEGVETEASFKMLENLGVEHFQGYLFSKPIPEDEYLRFLRTQ